MRPGVGAFAITFVALTIRSGSAAATDCAGPLSPCINDDTLWPHAGPSRFQAVGGSATVGASHLGFALVTSYLSRPIVLKVVSPGNGTDEYVINDQVNGSFLWAYGVSRRLELDLALPITFGQSGAGLTPITGGPGLHDTAVRDMRFGFTYALLRSESQSPQQVQAGRAVGGLAARVEVSAPTGDRDQFAGERSGVFVPSLSADGRLGSFYAAAEVGARVRPTTQLLGSRIGSQLLGALGVGLDVLSHERLSIGLEAWMLPTLVSQAGGPMGTSGGPTLIPAEWQLSARSSPLASHDLSFQLGGGGGIGDAVTAAHVRLVLSIRWAPSAEAPPP
jgi:hypothetical protein